MALPLIRPLAPSYWGRGRAGGDWDGFGALNWSQGAGRLGDVRTGTEAGRGASLELLLSVSL